MPDATDRHQPGPPPGPLGRLAAFAYRRRRTVIVAWVALLAGVMVLAPRLAGEYSADYAAPGSDSKAARQLVQERFGGFSSETIDVVWQSPAGAQSPAVRGEMDRFVSWAQGLEGVGSPEPVQVSRDGTIAITRLQLDRPGSQVPVETGEKMIDEAEATSRNGLEIGLGGPPIQNAQGGPGPETVGLIAAAIVLLIVFGSLIAAGLPLAVALFGLGVSAPLVEVLAGIATVPDWATAVVGLIGIGVGIDYALLVITRFRAALAKGATTESAIRESVATAGRSVLIAGGTVIIAVLGLAVLGLPYMTGVALSASLGVLVVMIAAITLLPALLGVAGPRVDRLRLPLLGRRTADASGHGALAFRWSRAVQRRPWVAIAAASALLLVLTAPVTGLWLGFPGAGQDQAGKPTRVAYDLTSRGFGEGANGPLTIAADVRSPDAARALRTAADDIRAVPGVASVAPPRFNAERDTALMLVTPSSAPQSKATRTLVEDLRDDVLPASLQRAGVPAYVGGSAALVVDQSDYIAERLPLFVGAVVGLSFLLLVAAFRAPLIAVKAGVMNLLSVGASFGAVALFAQGGFFGGLIGIDTEVPVPPFIPVMMFAILFGLSMDYEVFLLSRVREEYLKSGSTSRAVTEGIARTARVITAAAAIMVVVFLAFAVSDEVFLRLMGIGMATAILVDATIVRMVLVPAVMQVLGRANWWIPGWLDRLVPQLDHEPIPRERPAMREQPAEA